MIDSHKHEATEVETVTEFRVKRASEMHLALATTEFRYSLQVRMIVRRSPRCSDVNQLSRDNTCIVGVLCLFRIRLVVSFRMSENISVTSLT